MKHIHLLSAPLLAGLLALASCGDKDPISSISDTADPTEAAKITRSGSWAMGSCETCPFPPMIHLPNGWRPEGIALGQGSTFYSGSAVDGAILKGDLRTGESSILVQGTTGNQLLGLDYDKRNNRIFAAGRITGKGFVYDADSGALLATYAFPNGTVINDVIVTATAAYFTDSRQPNLYVVRFGSGGQLPANSAVEVLPLTGDYEFLQTAPSPSSLNNNGIVATPDGRTLILVNMGGLALYRVDAATGVAKTIQLDTTLPPHGDGLLLEGKDLYVVLNFSNKILKVRLNDALDAGTVTRTITDQRFDIPTTLRAFGNSLYVINARFTTPPGPTVAYNIVQV